MLPHDVFILAMVMINLAVIVANGAPANLDLEDYQTMLPDDEVQSIDKGNVSARNKRNDV